MDASNYGLAVLNPVTKQYIQLQFDQEEKDLIHTSTGSDGFNINVREQLCIALAAWIFGPTWSTSPVVLVKAWSDNTSAVSWTNKLASSNQMGQEVNRAIGLAEALFGFRMSCGHLPGSINIMADAGSRAWSPLMIKSGLTFPFNGSRSPFRPISAKSTRPSQTTSIASIGPGIKTEVRIHVETMVRVVLLPRFRQVATRRCATTFATACPICHPLLVLNHDNDRKTTIHEHRSVRH